MAGGVRGTSGGTGMGIRVYEDCRGCHRTTRLNPAESESAGYGFCESCKQRASSDPMHWLKPQLQELAVDMGRNFFCKECEDAGYFGFLNPDGWLAGEIGDCRWLQWLIKRECPKCHGDPQSQLPPRPKAPQIVAAIAELQSMAAGLKEAVKTLGNDYSYSYAANLPPDHPINMRSGMKLKVENGMTVPEL